MSKLPAEVNLIIAFSTRRHGNMSLYYGDTSEALNNRKSFLAELGIDYRQLVCPGQVHKDGITIVTEKDRGRGALSYEDSIPETDAFITDKKNVPLAIFSADCLSVFLYDQKTPAIGMVHAGWRSSKLNIIAKTIKLMQEKFGTDPSKLYAGFGSSIRGCCYEVSPEFKKHFTTGLKEKNGRLYLDLAEVNSRQLLEAGLNEANIYPPQVCTFCNNDEFFSFRKEGEACGRMMSVVMLK
jgi:YfiH family protein